MYKIICCQRDAEELQCDIESIVRWAEENQFEFNVSKCAVITYTTKRNPILFEYKLSNNILERKTELRDLGVQLRADISMESHVNIITSEALRNFGFIKRCSRFFSSQETIKQLFNSLVRSKLEYCSVAWDTSQVTLRDKIEKVQNKFLRYLCSKIDKISPMFISNKILRERFQVESLEERRKQASIIYGFKILNGFEENQNFLEQLQFNASRINRNRNLMYLPHIRTELEKNLPLYRISNIINNYPELPLFNCSLKKFKALVRA